MKNVYDIRYEKKLSYILNTKFRENNFDGSHNRCDGVAVILYLYYIDTISDYFKYIDVIPNDIDIYILSSRVEVLDKLKVHMQNRNCSFILKENRGRDISALLIASADIVKKYQYVCFIHDKKEHKAIYKKDTELWIENLWGNLIGSEYYIRNLLQLFEDNPTLGILAPPAPIGDSANAWYGFGWYRSFDITKTLAQKLELKADIDINKPPITLGTALWFRTKALEKLYTLNWRYSDFDDDKLKNQNYLSYGVERIFAYVAQDAGFDTGEVMTLEYAQKQNSYLQYSTAKIFAETEKYFPFLSIFCLERYRPNVDRLIRFAKENEKILLYGYGNMGSFCLETLRRNGIQNVEAFLASNVSGDKMHDGVKVIQIDELDHYEYHEAGVVITVADTGIQDDMVERLKEKDIDNYMIFCM